MAVPGYTTDLTTNEIFLDGGGTAWTTVGGGRTTDPETDDYFQGSSCWSHDPFSSGIEGGIFPSAQTITSGDAAFFWLKCDVVATLATNTNGGMQALIGSSATAYKGWYVRGSDDYAAGGWVCVAIDPTVTQSFITSPAPTATTSWFGARWNVPAGGASKGYPMKVDAIRQGRGQLLINGGQSGNLATFAGIATVNDAQSAKWGLFEAQEGGAAGYRWKGLMSFGPTSLTEFTDSNINIFIENTPYVGASFNRIEIENTGSKLNWTNISFTALGTVAKGELEMIDNATEFNDTGGVFTDMSTFVYLSNYTGTRRTWRRCGQVTQGGSTLTDCTFEESTAAVALVVDDLSLVTGCNFASSGTGHAVNLGTIAATTAVDWDNTESGYAIQTGTAANRTILVSVSASQTLTINVATGASTPTYYNTGTGDVSVVAGTVTTLVTCKDSITKNAIEGVAVTIKAGDAGPLPYLDSVTISQTSGTATVVHTGHGLSTGQKVQIKGANQNDYNRIKQITVTTADAYTYTVPSGTTSPATGTITSTAVVIDGLTNASGIIQDSRTLSANQAIVGLVQKGSTPPVYKPQNIDTTIDSDNGVSLSFLLTAD